MIAVWEIARTERAGAGVPDDEAWQRAADVVRLQWKPGDLIVFAPAWIDPVGRRVLGDLIPVEMAARMDAARYGSIWELTMRGARAPEADGAHEDFATDVEGGVSVRHLTREPAQVVTDFAAALSSARSTGALARGPSLELAEVGFAPHRCIQVVPQAGGTVTITFEHATLGSSLVGYVGLADVFTRRDVREPGRLTVRVGDREVAKVTAGVDDGWVRFAATTTPGPAPVTFTAEAVGPGARDRLICFAAEARR
jgi:hypothetical protein